MKFKAVICCVICALLLAGALSCKKRDEGANKPRKVRVVLDWTPNTNHAGLYVAQALGYFKQAGLDVQITQPGANSAEKIVASEQAEFGVSYQESVTIARSQSVPIRSIAAVIQHNTSGFASLADSGIRSAKDFEGRRYGSSGWPSELEILRQVMESADAFYDSVTVVHGVTDFFSTIGRDADFEWIYYGWDGIQAELRGIRLNFTPIRSLDPTFDFYTPVLIANEMLINSEPELVRAFLGAVSKGYAYCIANPGNAAELMLKAVPELDKDLVVASLQYLQKEFKADAPKWGIQKLEVWQSFGEWLHQRRIIGIGISAADAFTNEFLP